MTLLLLFSNRCSQGRHEHVGHNIFLSRLRHRAGHDGRTQATRPRLLHGHLRSNAKDTHRSDLVNGRLRYFTDTNTTNALYRERQNVCTYLLFTNRFTPIGVASVICGKIITIADLATTLVQLSLFIMTTVGGFLFYQLVVLQLIYFFVLKKSPWPYYVSLGPALATAFATASKWDVRTGLHLTNNVEIRRADPFMPAIRFVCSATDRQANQTTTETPVVFLHFFNNRFCKIWSNCNFTSYHFSLTLFTLLRSYKITTYKHNIVEHLKSISREHVSFRNDCTTFVETVSRFV